MSDLKREFHPLSNIFPLMSDAEINDLGEDMLEHGQREPIWLYENKILDGRNRYTACLLKDIEPRFSEYRGPDPIGFVVSMNLYRRQLSTSQRGISGAKIAKLRDGQRKSASPNGEGVAITQADAASTLNVSKRTIERGRIVIEEGAPELLDAVEQGNVPISAAAEYAKQTAPAEQAEQIAAHGSPAAAVKASKLTSKSPPADLIKADRAASHSTAKAKLDDVAESELVDALRTVRDLDIPRASAIASIATHSQKSFPKLISDVEDFMAGLKAEWINVHAPSHDEIAESAKTEAIFKAIQTIEGASGGEGTFWAALTESEIIALAMGGSSASCDRRACVLQESYAESTLMTTTLTRCRALQF
jgi:hypothetical protein